MNLSPQDAPQMVLTTLPDAASAQAIAARLVDERLAACVQILPGLTSVYRWQGKRQVESEVLVLLKTTRQAWPALEAALIDAHPYDVPEVLAVPVEAWSAAYGAWVAGQVELG